MADVIDVIIRSPEAILYQGAADSLSTFNEKGPLDVLPLHENFISIITQQVVVHKDNDRKLFPVEYGILKVTENEVNVLLGVETVEIPLS